MIKPPFSVSSSLAPTRAIFNVKSLPLIHPMMTKVINISGFIFFGSAGLRSQDESRGGCDDVRAR